MNPNVSRGISVTQLAVAWGCSRGNVSRLIKKGMPMTSLEDATAWRAENATRGIGYRSKGSPASVQGARAEITASENEKKSTPEPGVEGCGEASEATSDAERRKSWFAERGLRKPTKQLRTLASSLRASIEVESEALRLVQEAQFGNNIETLPLRIAAFNKAKEGRMMSEKFVREFDLQTKSLLTWEDAVEMAGRFMIPLITRLRSIPKRAGAIANPAQDVYAESVISKEIEAALKEAQDLYGKAVTPGA